MTYYLNWCFDETIFSLLEGRKPTIEEQHENDKIIWNAQTLFHLDFCTNKYGLKVQIIIYLQSIANQLGDH